MAQISVTWPSSDCDEDQISTLDNLKKAQHWRTVKIPQEIAFYLKLCNRLHFGQANGTPFAVSPLEEEFDWAANLHHSKLVLEGSYSNLELTFLEKKLLEHCKKEREADIIEQTTTSPSGKHLGHYKALLSRGPDDPQSDEGKDFHNKQKAFVQAHVDMLNYAICHRYSYK
eukprot:102434-Ditylum_brightwellii.AAC.1